MLKKEVLDKTKHYLGELTDEQKTVLCEFVDKEIKEPELFEKLGVAEEKLKEFLEAVRKEKAVFFQELSEKELAAVAGGEYCEGGYSCSFLNNIPDDVTCGADNYYSCDAVERYDDPANCHFMQERNIYGGQGFANCASTVESNSFCARSDACYAGAVHYQNMRDCHKAWE